MSIPILLASASEARARMLAQAGVPFDVETARLDEQTIKQSLLADNTPTRDVADALAEAKAIRVSARHPDRLVLGGDQVLDFDGTLISKAQNQDAAAKLIARMAGKTHRLHSAAVICEAGRPVWRHVATVRLTMRPLSTEFIDDYVQRNWPGISHCVGGYKLEEEGVRLFAAIEGDYFTVLGMPLLPVLDYLTIRGVLKS